MNDDVLSQEQQTVETTDEENLFDDLASEDMPVEEPETNEQNEPDEPFLTIQYDKQEYGLSRNEAKDLAEKGKNYDRMREKYNNLYDNINRLASMNNMSVDDYLNRLDSTQTDYMVNLEFDKLKEAHPNDSDEVLQEIAQRRVMESMAKNRQLAQEAKEREVSAQQQAVQREVDKFLSEYPEFKLKSPEELDPMVFEYVKGGYTLLEAYNKWMAGNANKDVEKANQLNAENKKRSLGNTTNAGKVETDDFLKGFLNG